MRSNLTGVVSFCIFWLVGSVAEGTDLDLHLFAPNGDWISFVGAVGFQRHAPDVDVHLAKGVAEHQTATTATSTATVTASTVTTAAFACTAAALVADLTPEMFDATDPAFEPWVGGVVIRTVRADDSRGT